MSKGLRLSLESISGYQSALRQVWRDVLSREKNCLEDQNWYFKAY